MKTIRPTRPSIHAHPSKQPVWGYTLAFCVCILAVPAAVSAATLYWDGANNGPWGTASNWSTASGAATPDPVSAPGLADDVVFNIATLNAIRDIQLLAPEAANSLTFNNTSATRFLANTTGPRTFTLGTGGLVVNNGAGTVTFGGTTSGNAVNFSLTGSQTWTNHSGSLLSHATSVSGGGPISLLNAGSQTFTIAGSGNTALFGSIQNGAGTLALTKEGAGTLTLNAVNTYTGTTTIQGGTLNTGITTASLNGSTSITVNNGATLAITANGGSATEGSGADRIGNTTPITLNGANLSIDQTTAARNKEVFGQLVLASGASKATLSGTSGIATLRTTDINRSAGTSLLVQGRTSTSLGLANAAGGGQYFVIDNTTGLLAGGGGAAASATISIVPFAVYGASASDNGSNFLTYDTSATTNGGNASTIRALRPLAGAELSTTFANGSSNLHNVRLTGTAITGIDSATTINSLILTGTGGVSGTGTLTVNSGAILATSTSTGSLGVDTLAFGSQEAVIHSVAALSISGNVTGSGGLTKSGASLLTLSGNTGYTGTTTINQGSLQIGAGGSTGSIGGNGNIVFFDSSNQLVFDRSDAALVAANAISGAGNVLHQGTGTVALSGSSGYTGGTRVSGGGVLSVSTLANGASPSNIGASTAAAANLILHEGSTLRYTGGAVSTDRLFQVGNTSGLGGTATLDASGGGAVNFTNPGAIGYGTSNQERVLNLTGTNTGNNTLAAALGNNGTQNLTLNKNGTGTWRLTGTNTYTGNTTVSAGTLELAGGANASPSYTISHGASFTQSSGAWSTDLFHSSGSAGTILIADLADSSDTSSILRYSVDAGGAKTLVFNDGNPFAQAYAGSVDAWSDEWTIHLDTLVILQTSDFTDLNLMASTGGYSLLNLDGKLNIQAWDAGNTPTLFTDVQNGDTIYLSGGVSLGNYKVLFTADSFELVYQSSFAVPEPGTLGLVALALALLRRRLRPRRA